MEEAEQVSKQGPMVSLRVGFFWVYSLCVCEGLIRHKTTLVFNLMCNKPIYNISQ